MDINSKVLFNKHIRLTNSLKYVKPKINKKSKFSYPLIYNKILGKNRLKLKLQYESQLSITERKRLW